MKKNRFLLPIALLIILACSLPGTTSDTASENTDAVQTAVAGTQTALALAAPPVSSPVAPDSAAPAATPTIVHQTIPGEPPNRYESLVSDRNSSTTAAQRAANGGENFDINLLERPFNAITMDIYYPDLDIIEARLDRSGSWAYAEIELVNVRPDEGILGGNYGIELDLDEDGRGDWLILASQPQSEWTTLGVRVWQDSNNDVGNDIPVHADYPQHGNGYELYFDQGNNPDPDIAWARISPQNPAVVQIAFKNSLIANDNHFLWNAWSDQGVFNPAFYDYNDHFTHDEAGSPLPGLQRYYPLKALFEVDNTCRMSLGFELAGDEPGGCPVYVPPTPVPTRVPPTVPPTPIPPTPTETPIIIY